MSEPAQKVMDQNYRQLMLTGNGAHHLGWILNDGFLNSVQLWIDYFKRQPGLYVLGRLVSAGHSDTPGSDLHPLLAQLGGQTAPVLDTPDPARDFFAVLAQLRELLDNQQQLAVLVIQRSWELDDFTQRVVDTLAQEGRLRLAIHLPPGRSLPARWQRLEQSGLLLDCPVPRLAEQEISEYFETNHQILVPELSAIAVYQAIGGELLVLESLIHDTEPEKLSHALATGRIGMLTDSQQLLTQLRLRRTRAADNIRELMDLCAVAGHLPLSAARTVSSRQLIDLLLDGALLRLQICQGSPVLTFSGSLLAQYWVGLLSPYELENYKNLLAAQPPCCGMQQITLTLARLGSQPGHDTLELCAMLDLACEQGQFSSAARFAKVLHQRVKTLDEQSEFQASLNALARYTALIEGPYQALRVLNTQGNIHQYDWQDPAGRALVVQQCLDTGRLFPTAQRLATELGLPVPAATGDPIFWLLLPEDSLRRHMQRGLSAALKLNLRAAAVHFVAGLRKCHENPALPNARALRGSLLANAAITLALGGYHKGWNELSKNLRAQPEVWHSQVSSAWHASDGMVQMQAGALTDGREIIAQAGMLGQLVDRNNLWEGAHAVEVWLEAQQLNDESATAQTTFPLSELLSFGRSTLEGSASQALMREPEALTQALELAQALADPRGRAITLSARAALGLYDPRDAVEELQSMGQHFMAAWVLDGIILRRMIIHRGDLALPQSRRIEELIEFATELILRCQEVELEPLDAELVRALRQASDQTLAVLPFAAYEAKRRKLTPRESQILELVRSGASNRQIASELTVSIRTVEGHIAAILDKYALDSRAALIMQSVPVA